MQRAANLLNSGLDWVLLVSLVLVALYTLSHWWEGEQ